jgi:hypothetical protein
VPRRRISMQSNLTIEIFRHGASTHLIAGYNRDMPRVGEFCASNITRLLLKVVIVVTLVLAIGVWLFNSPGRGTPIEQPTHASDPVK